MSEVRGKGGGDETHEKQDECNMVNLPSMLGRDSGGAVTQGGGGVRGKERDGFEFELGEELV